MAAIQVWQQDIGSLFFKHTANIFIPGPSGSGKTEFVKKMIEYKEDLFDIQPQQIVVLQRMAVCPQYLART